MVGKTFFNNHLDDLIECVNFASDEIMQIYNSESFDQEEKSDGSPLTTVSYTHLRAHET